MTGFGNKVPDPHLFELIFSLRGQIGRDDHNGYPVVQGSGQSGHIGPVHFGHFEIYRYQVVVLNQERGNGLRGFFDRFNPVAFRFQKLP